MKARISKFFIWTRPSRCEPKDSIRAAGFVLCFRRGCYLWVRTELGRA